MAGLRVIGRHLSPVAAPLAVILLAVGTVRRIADPSPWLHLRVGAFLLDGDRFTLPDPWAPFADRAYVPTQWLPEMLVTELTRPFGLAAVVWSRSAGIALVAALLFVAARRVAGRLLAAGVVALTLGAAWPTLTERPQLLGFVLLIPLISAWTACARDGVPRWQIVPLTWLLACTHGIWSLGVVVGAAVLVGRGLHAPGQGRLAVLWGLSAATAAATPLGPQLLLTPLTAGYNGRQFVEEWMPSSAREPNVLCALAMVALLVGLWLWSRHRPTPWELLLLVASVALVLVMQRTVPVGAFILAPLLAEAATGAVGPSPQPYIPRKRELSWLAVGVCVACLICVPLAKSAASQAPRYVPVALESRLGSLPQGTRVIAEGDVTGWLLYAAPNLQPVFDLRIESYSASHVKRFITTMAADPGWQDFVAATAPRAAVLLADSPLALALQEESGWTTVAQDRGFLLLEAR